MSGAGSDAGGMAGSTDTPGKGQPPKNKECPFCHELFTSSSLGRHLDLYIRDKNPKPPDGVHDVTQIRQLRGSITRRQPKRSLGAQQQQQESRDGSTPTRPLASAQPQLQSTADDAGAPTPVNGTEFRTAFKPLAFQRPGWEASGVMTDIPTVLDERPGSERTTALRRSHRGDVGLKRKWAEEHGRRRATELALQELVDSINAAT